jgi:hypothetical protein
MTQTTHVHWCFCRLLTMEEALWPVGMHDARVANGLSVRQCVLGTAWHGRRVSLIFVVFLCASCF